jgi:hypothetical protein
MVETTITVDTANIMDRAADDRGRVRLGPEFAGKSVEVAIIDSEDSKDD